MLSYIFILFISFDYLLAFYHQDCHSANRNCILYFNGVNIGLRCNSFESIYEIDRNDICFKSYVGHRFTLKDISFLFDKSQRIILDNRFNISRLIQHLADIKFDNIINFNLINLQGIDANILSLITDQLQVFKQNNFLPDLSLNFFETHLELFENSSKINTCSIGDKSIQTIQTNVFKLYAINFNDQITYKEKICPLVFHNVNAFLIQFSYLTNTFYKKYFNFR